MRKEKTNRRRSGNNRPLAELFHRMAEAYGFMGGEERFRAIAYEKVARQLLQMRDDISMYAGTGHRLEVIPGIGAGIAGKIEEYLKTGRIKTYEKLKRKVPPGIAELMAIRGLGPVTLRHLHEELGINDQHELEEALREGRIVSLKGFGEKRMTELKQSLKMEKSGKRLPYDVADRMASSLLRLIRSFPGVEKAEVAGSLRRKKDTIGDIDLIIQADPAYWKKISARFASLPGVAKVLVRGRTRVSVLLTERNVQVDIRIVQKEDYGAALLYFTGSREHTIKLRAIAKARGLRINEYGIFDLRSGEKLAGETEEGIYQVLHMRYIPPANRLDKGEIEAAGIA